ncbi:FAD-dependent oxidoreductase [Prochlorococcus marinus]|uniref:Putative thiamine biosynthesis oxidoreductase n=1 Tax=Prochlorococcus marinus (strain MIT 9303) TaxID=59922 RepID=A2CDJ9_PROM3|nr:putative thiamine biosynthesis oxidoreductase [Prochlorococcus marinus str. MIT 9303]
MAAMRTESVLILGGGLMGLALAHKLARRGSTVEVLSRRRNEAAGFVAAGMLAPHAEGLSGEQLRLGQLSLDLIPAWVNQIETDSGLCCGLRQCGIVVPFATATQRDLYPTAYLGETLDRSGLEREVPGLGPNWQAGLLFSQDGQIDNRRRLMRALETACVSLGVRFQEGVEVQEILRDGDTFRGVRMRNAEGEMHTLTSQKAVLCCGAWSAQLLPALAIVPVKGQMLSLQGPRDSLKRIVFGPGTYLVPREDGLLVVGATSEPEAGFMEGLTPFGQQQLQAGIDTLLPEASQWPPMERWWGFRPCTPDGGPLLGRSSVDGLWLATGHHRNGVLLAAITAKLLDKCLGNQPLNKTEQPLMHAFRWDRFHEQD